MRYLLLIIVILLSSIFYISSQLGDIPTKEQSKLLYKTLQAYSDHLSRQWHIKGCADPEILKHSVLRLNRATAFLLEPNVLVTNHHVMQRVASEELILSSFYEYQNNLLFNRELEVLYSSYWHDISVARVSTDLPFLWAEPVKLATSEPKYGDLLVYIGHPYDEDEKYIVTYGSVYEQGWFQSFYYYPSYELINHNDFFYAKGYTRYGNSGSPVFNCAGEIVAVHFNSNIEKASNFDDVFSIATTLLELRRAIQRAGLDQ